MKIRVIVNGAGGKMGQLCVKAVENDADLVLAGQTGRSDDLALQIKNHEADVVVDLTRAESVLNNLQTIIEAGARPVIGTSGLLKDQVEMMQKKCLQLKRGGIIAPNFALGAVLMMKYAREMAKYFSAVEIIEMHHDKKLDSPSGTAVRTAEMLAETLNGRTAKQAAKETISGARGALYQDINIHAIRLPGLVAHQQVIFGSLGETLTIRHDTIDRLCFMPGIMLACKKVMELNHLVYGLENIL
ncbi:MAG TPA: 4-hydroxy-tetrahydrodipicolinate reductase [Gammaproteobacteria bacterium]|nr:4-hydroxy-tetrahydrodipicolinate reductase [Gammaproteobacteria bacterium]